mgnify:CR=1 FL=1
MDGVAIIRTELPCIISEVKIDSFLNLIHIIICDIIVDVLSNISFGWKDILKQVDLVTMDKTKFTVKGKDIKWSLLPSGYPTCQAVDLTESFDLKKQTPMFFVFKFFLRENLGISLQIEDRRKSLLKRSLRSQRHDYVGSDEF